MLVLVEGESDVQAVLALAELAKCDLESAGIEVRSARGVTNYSKVLYQFIQQHPEQAVCGLYDAPESRYVQRALERAGYSAHKDPETHDFFACNSDLEDELIRAAGAETVLEILQTEGELPSFHRFQAMPQHRDSPANAQLHRFLGTRATRKIRCARLITLSLTMDRLPRPFDALARLMRQEVQSKGARCDA